MIDRKKLEAELSSAIAKDNERKAIDTMKKRAILSASSYDDFKNLVACASLTPLSRDDFAKRLAIPVNHSISSSAAQSSIRGGTTLRSNSSLPRTAGEFDREWRRVGKAAGGRVRLLFECYAAGALPGVFRAELDAVLLGDAISASLNVLEGTATSIEGCVSPGIADWRASCIPLAALAETGGFMMAREFLLKVDLQRITRIVELLRAVDKLSDGASAVAAELEPYSVASSADAGSPAIAARLPCTLSITGFALADQLQAAYLDWKGLK